jgi:hypothetical protein
MAVFVGLAIFISYVCSQRPMYDQCFAMYRVRSYYLAYLIDYNLGFYKPTTTGEDDHIRGPGSDIVIK